MNIKKKIDEGFDELCYEIDSGTWYTILISVVILITTLVSLIGAIVVLIIFLGLLFSVKNVLITTSAAALTITAIYWIWIFWRKP